VGSQHDARSLLRWREDFWWSEAAARTLRI